VHNDIIDMIFLYVDSYSDIRISSVFKMYKILYYLL